MFNFCWKWARYFTVLRKISQREAVLRRENMIVAICKNLTEKIFTSVVLPSRNINPERSKSAWTDYLFHQKHFWHFSEFLMKSLARTIRTHKDSLCQDQISRISRYWQRFSIYVSNNLTCLRIRARFANEETFETLKDEINSWHNYPLQINVKRLLIHISGDFDVLVISTNVANGFHSATRKI